MTEAKLQFIKRVEEMSDEDFMIVQSLFTGAPIRSPRLPYYRDVTNYLRNLGFRANLRGYNYIRTALLIILKEKESFNSRIMVLYKLVAEKENSTCSKVERSIRHAIIDTATSHPENFVHFSEKEIPTISEFLFAAADELKSQKK